VNGVRTAVIGTARSVAGRVARPRLAIALACLTALAGSVPLRSAGADDQPRQVVVLGDPHLPGKHLEAKIRVLETIDSWPGVDLVVAVGDLCQARGTEEEYAAAAAFFGRLRRPFLPVNGNHDYLYADHLGLDGKGVQASPEIRAMKLQRFQKAFDLPDLHGTRRLGGYLLVFLAVDHLSSHRLAEMSDGQLAWLDEELRHHRSTPTIVFFHAPLEGTLGPIRPELAGPSWSAQPARRIRQILAANPQVFLWVSGHTHTTPKQPDFASPANLYDGRVTNIHDPDMNRAGIWTNSLLLFPDRVVVKTFDHRHGAWLPQFERTVPRPVP
jgi:3',5'-cyclic-AMP phosphodiesterase